MNKTITNKNFDWEKIKKNCGKFVMFHSDNDPYVPMTKAKNLGKKLDAEFNIIRGAGHFNEDSGYTKFPELLQKINDNS